MRGVAMLAAIVGMYGAVVVAFVERTHAIAIFGAICGLGVFIVAACHFLEGRR